MYRNGDSQNLSASGGPARVLVRAEGLGLLGPLGDHAVDRLDDALKELPALLRVHLAPLRQILERHRVLETLQRRLEDAREAKKLEAYSI